MIMKIKIKEYFDTAHMEVLFGLVLFIGSAAWIMTHMFLQS